MTLKTRPLRSSHAPTDSHALPGSTPVVSIGNTHTATVATVGFNPSLIEFLDRRGHELIGPSRHRATYRWPGTEDLADAPLEVILPFSTIAIPISNEIHTGDASTHSNRLQLVAVLLITMEPHVILIWLNGQLTRRGPGYSLRACGSDGWLRMSGF